MAELKKTLLNVKKDADRNAREQIKALEKNPPEAKQIHNSLRKRKEGIIKEKNISSNYNHRFPEQRV